MVYDANCVFCKIVKSEIPVKFIYESDNFFAFPDANPKIEGHTLLIPKDHFVNLMDLPESLGGELLEGIKSVVKMRLKEGFEGFNLVCNNFPVAGQIVMHAHIHILPRKKNDGFDLVL